ncbi:hypothetical protein Tco_0503507 [Tanacetum coccineum]
MESPWGGLWPTSRKRKEEKVYLHSKFSYKKYSRMATLCDGGGSSSKASGFRSRKNIWKCDSHGQYKIIVRVIDDIRSTSLVLFDNMVHKLLDEMSCWKLMEQYQGAGKDDEEDVEVTTKGRQVSKLNSTEYGARNIMVKKAQEEESNAINIDDDNKEEEGANRGKTGVLQDNVVKE